jgi:hypothetical protein
MHAWPDPARPISAGDSASFVHGLAGSMLMRRVNSIPTPIGDPTGSTAVRVELRATLSRGSAPRSTVAGLAVGESGGLAIVGPRLRREPILSASHTSR